MSNVIKLSGAHDLPRERRAIASRMDTVMVTPREIQKWKLPPFQRPLRVNDKVIALAEGLKSGALGGVIPGVITIGELNGEQYLIDGQHRKEAFIMSKIDEAVVDVRICTFDTMAAMGEHFVELNTALVKMRPDDVLRGLESSLPGLEELRKKCPFVGYDQVRRGTHGAILSVSAVMRCWFGSATEVPAAQSTSVVNLAKEFSDEECKRLIAYLNAMYTAWGREQDNYRLWSNLNLCVVAWLWRRTVLGRYSAKSVALTAQQFTECATGLADDPNHTSWLVGRNLTDRDRGHCYNHIKVIFAARLKEMTGKQPMLPAPVWAPQGGSAYRVG